MRLRNQIKALDPLMCPWPTDRVSHVCGKTRFFLQTSLGGDIRRAFVVRTRQKPRCRGWEVLRVGHSLMGFSTSFRESVFSHGRTLLYTDLIAQRAFCHD